MSWIAAGSMAASVVGGALSGRSARKAAAKAAGERREQAGTYWDAAQFRPVGMTTRFGSSNYERDANGNVTGAGYELNPEFQAMQNHMIGNAGSYGLNTADQAMQAGQGLFGLGQQYMATSPEEAAQSWMGRQQDILAPGRERGLSAMRNSVFNKGTQGLAVGATGTRPGGGAGLGNSNPEMEAYYNAIAQQDAGLAGQAMEQGRSQVNFGAGLFGTGMGLQQNAYNPLDGMMQGAQRLEDLGRQPYQMGLELGQTNSTLNGNARLNWANIMGGATASQQQANAPSMWGTAFSALGSGLGSMGGGFTGGGSMPTPDLYANPANSGLMSAFGNNTSNAWDDGSYASNALRRGM